MVQTFKILQGCNFSGERNNFMPAFFMGNYISQFFSISTILIAVLAVVLVGKGIAALQEAGWIGQALVAVPRIDWLGIYPSWQSLLAQIVVAVIAIGGFYLNARSSRALARATK